MMRLWLFIFFIPSLFWAQTTRIFVAAHQDDWQLFMNPNVAKSIENTDDNTVIIHTTAGDAGHGVGNNAYYLAREEGSLRALRFLVNKNNAPSVESSTMKEETTTINGHKIVVYRYQNTSMYLLRLPDGNGDGSGFPLHQNKSLACFYAQQCANLEAIDASTTYSNITDLKQTIAAIIKEEKEKNDLEIHLPDTDITFNPGDHSDHQTSAKIVQEAARGVGQHTLYRYVNYATAQHPPNLNEDDFMLSAATWGVTASGLGDFKHYTTWDNIHNAWVGKQYFRKQVITP